MKNSIIYIDFDKGTLADAQGGRIMSTPSLQMGAEPTWELHFAGFEQGTLPDMSDAVSWRAAIDTDFLSGTTPMVRSLDIDGSDATSGIIRVPLNTNTTTFIEKVDGRDSLPAYFELYGLDAADKVIYDYRFGISCRGTVDYQGGPALPVVSGGVTLTDVYALLRAPLDFRFSADGSTWHDSQQAGDRYYQTAYPSGAWGETIELPSGEMGASPTLTVANVSTLSAGAQATVSISGTSPNLHISFGIPSGFAGADGEDGTDGTDGTSAFLHIAYATSSTGAGFTFTQDDDHPYISLLTTDTPASPASSAFTTWARYLPTATETVHPTTSTTFEVGKVYSCTVSQNAIINVSGMEAGKTGFVEVFLTVEGSPSIVLGTGLRYHNISISGSCHLIIQTVGTQGEVFVL